MKTEDMLRDPSRFVPAWQGEWQPHPAMLDFEEKWRAFHTPNGRLMSCAHRGDRNELYPENSLEGFLSVILAGADILEADIHTTRDGVLVIMHDDTVKRTTNVDALRRAGVSLPASDRIADWRYEELRALRLLGTDGSTVTDYAVPTLRELILLAKDRCFITLDKIHAFSFEESVEPLLCELDAHRTVLIPYNYDLPRVLALREMQLRRHGVCSPFFAHIGEDKGVMSPKKMQTVPAILKENGLAPVLRGGEYLPEEREALSPYLAPLKGTHRIYAETLRAIHDNEAHWQEMTSLGYNVIMGNKIYALLAFIKQRHFT